MRGTRGAAVVVGGIVVVSGVTTVLDPNHVNGSYHIACPPDIMGAPGPAAPPPRAFLILNVSPFPPIIGVNFTFVVPVAVDEKVLKAEVPMEDSRDAITPSAVAPGAATRSAIVFSSSGFCTRRTRVIIVLIDWL